MMDLTRLSLLSCLLLALPFAGFYASAQTSIPLYPDTIPNSIPFSAQELEDSASHQLFNVTVPTLTVYLPQKKIANHIGVIICPGGGYGSLVIRREGYDVARALSRKGFASFVLKYRLPDNRTMRDRTLGPLQDAQQAIKYVREHAKENNIDPDHVGLMGFSAGGHLASMAGVETHSLIPNKLQTSLRPEFLVLVYPVISMDTLVGHKGSTFNLLGPSPTAEQISYNSTQNRVSAHTPPTFITVAGDDDLLENSLLFYHALHSFHVPAELDVFAKGGHGYLSYPSFGEWSGRCINWLYMTLSANK